MEHVHLPWRVVEDATPLLGTATDRLLAACVLINTTCVPISWLSQSCDSHWERSVVPVSQIVLSQKKGRLETGESCMCYFHQSPLWYLSDWKQPLVGGTAVHWDGVRILSSDVGTGVIC